MKTYDTLSKLPFLKKYSYKFLFVAFLGIHVPLLGILFYALFVSNISTATVIVVILILTLGATAMTLHILNNLLVPIVESRKALNAYLEHQTIPNLPITYHDEVGEVLKNIQFTIESLDEADREKQDVAELISHDLRTPVLQSIEMIKFLKEDGEDARQREEHLEILSEIAYKQLGFLESMLKVLKSKHGEVNHKNFEILSISDMIDDLVNDLKSTIVQKDLKIVNSVPKELKLSGHAIGMQQVFENLLSNAIKFSENSGVIRIAGNKNNERVKIEIIDQGVGFTKQTEKTLFRKFVPGHLGTHGEPSTGLGLYLAKKIIEKHGGSIQPFSEGKGLGSRFVVSIPA